MHAIKLLLVVVVAAIFSSQCGRSSSSSRNPIPAPPLQPGTPPPKPTDANVPVAAAPQIGAGHVHTCILTNKREVYCWGDNTYGQLGSGNTNTVGNEAGDLENLTPVDLGSRFEPEKLFVGGHQNCVISTAGSVKCWGRNISAQLGIGSTTDQGNTPNQMGNKLPVVRLPSGLKAVHIALGQEYTCAALNNGKVVCWGNDILPGPSVNFGPGILGRGQPVQGDTLIGNQPEEMGDSLVPVDLGTDFFATRVAAGYATTCALSSAGLIKCWGANAYAQLGRDSTDPKTIGDDSQQMGNALPVVNIGSLNGRPLKTRSIYSRESHMCAITELNDAKCWGEATYGLYGLGSFAKGDGDDSMFYDMIGDGLLTNGSSVPETEMGDNLRSTDWGNGRKVQALALSWGRACGILDDGMAVRCHGLNRYDDTIPGGALGIGRIGVGTDRGSTTYPSENQGCYPRNSGSNGLDVILPPSIRKVGAKVLAVTTSAYDHTCLVFSNLKFACFGDNTFGAAGTGPESAGLNASSMENLPVRMIPGN